MKVKNTIVSMREHKKNISKYIPSIQINLKKAGKIKAERSIARILSGIGNEVFAQIQLKYDQKGNHCTKKEIEPFVIQNANEIGLNIEIHKGTNDYSSVFTIKPKN